MAIRGVILAVENYRAMGRGSLADKLPGTLEDAEKFRDWLIQTKGAAQGDIFFCPDLTADQISKAFRNLVVAGQNSTEELYVFYSGHGFSYNDNPFQQKPADILVGADFENLQDSGNACLQLREVQLALYQCLGPGTHFYFVDGCRNPVKVGGVKPGSLGWTRPFSQLGNPGVFTLFSTERGNFAALRSGFAAALVDGLKGRGRAKRRDGAGMWVTFDSLRVYLELVLAQPVAPDPGPGDGRILRIDPIPQYTCNVEVKNADGADRFTAQVLNAFGVPVGPAVVFQGPQTALQEFPDDYFVQVTHPTFALKPAVPARADLYDDCKVEFEKTLNPAPPAPPPGPPAPVPVSITGPLASTLEIRNLDTGGIVHAKDSFLGALQIESDIENMDFKIVHAKDSFLGALLPGSYQVRALETGWTAVRSLKFDIEPAAEPEQTVERVAPLKIDLGSRDPSRLRESLLQQIPGEHDPGRADFSEQLGDDPIAVEDLGLWLAILGASRISGIEFHKLKDLPLATFFDVPPGGSSIYFLSGGEGPWAISEATVWQPGEYRGRTEPMAGVAGLNGLCHMRADRPPGMQVVCFRRPDEPTCGIVTYCLPNRATLLAAASDKSGNLTIQQFILPLGHLLGNLSFQEQTRQPHNLLEAIRFTTLAERRVARMRSPAPPQLSEPSEDPKLQMDWQLWDDMLIGKFLDPVMALMAGYEMAQTWGSQPQPDQDKVKRNLEEAIGNLRIYFGILPDVELIAKIAGFPHTEPTSLPLFLTGLHAMENSDPLMPLPASSLTYVGPWVTWVGV